MLGYYHWCHLAQQVLAQHAILMTQNKVEKVYTRHHLALMMLLKMFRCHAEKLAERRNTPLRCVVP